MEDEVKPQPIRFVHGLVPECERDVNALANEYSITNVTFHQFADHVKMTVTLVHHSELRKAQIAGINPMVTRPR